MVLARVFNSVSQVTLRSQTCGKVQPARDKQHRRLINVRWLVSINMNGFLTPQEQRQIPHLASECVRIFPQEHLISYPKEKHTSFCGEVNFLQLVQDVWWLFFKKDGEGFCPFFITLLKTPYRSFKTSRSFKKHLSNTSPGRSFGGFLEIM